MNEERFIQGYMALNDCSEAAARNVFIYTLAKEDRVLLEEDNDPPVKGVSVALPLPTKSAKQIPRDKRVPFLNPLERFVLRARLDGEIRPRFGVK